MGIIWLYTIGSVVLVSLTSLVGILFLSMNEERLKRMVFVLVSVAVGALFGDVFIHILPELYKNSISPLTISMFVLIGILVFFILEKFLRWHHHHGVDEESYHSIQENSHIGYINLVSDGVHNFIDGVFIGIAYLVAIPVGIATTIAVLLHELPQEIGDFGILIHSGFSKKKALLLNILSASGAILGAILALLLGSNVEEFATPILALTAGTFVYIAGSDLVPELHKISDIKKSTIQLLAVVIGIVLMYLLLFID